MNAHHPHQDLDTMRMDRTDPPRLFAPIVLGAAILLSCARGAPSPTIHPEPAGDLQTGALAIPPLPLPPMARPGEQGTEPGLTFRLREAAPDGTPLTPAEPEPSRPSVVQTLDAARTARLLARLPALPPPDTAGFRFPAASPPPPRTGRVVLSTFPPPDTLAPPAPAARTSSPLRVVRVVPTGDTELAPHLTITFSEAMVPLTTVAGTETRTPPVRLTPQPPGGWSWIDSRTLRFQPDDRFPMATSYKVEVPAGTRPVTGPALDTAVVVEFSTPAPRAIGAWPGLNPEMTEEEQRRRSIRPRWGHGDDLARSTSRQPVVLIAFDQRVNPEEVLSGTRVIAAGLSHPVRLASRDEVAADSIVSRMVEELEDGRWVALRPIAPLPADTTVTVVLARGLSSAEGPLTTLLPQELRFRTYGPLRIAQHGCGADCRPGYPWMIHFTNPLDDAAWSPELVRVEPALDDMSIRVYGSDIQITGDARPNTRYVVTLSASLTDRFGQTLEGPRSVTFQVGEPHPTIALPGAPLIVLDPEGPPRVAFQSRGYDELRVLVFRVTPQQWNDYGAAVQRWHETRGETFTPPGELVSSTVVNAAQAGELTEAMIDVAPALRNGLGHAIVAISPEGTPPMDESGRRVRNVAHAWVQSTRIGLEATIDAEAVHVWASSLRTGQPLADVDITLLPTRTRAATRADGTARLPLTISGDDALIATLGDDVALLPSTEYPSPRGSGGSWQRRPTDELRWYMLTDRGLYQPGDTLHFKGWLRRITGSSGAALRFADDVSAIRFTMRGPRGEELGTRSLQPGELGGFSTTVALPEAMNLGHAGIQLEASGGDAARMGRDAYHAVQVQEFRRPEYEVRVDADPGPHIVGDVIAVTLAADYYGGGGLADAPLDWRVSTQPGTYSPPGWERWHFGRAQWGWAGFSRREPELLTGVTDAAGTHQLLIDLLSVEPPFTTSLRAEAQVHDVTRQIGSAGVDLLVHPAAVNAGLRMERTWLHPGQAAEVDIIVVDHDGDEVAGRRVSVVLERMPGGWRMEGAAQPDSGRVVCSVVSGVEPVPCTFTADSSGLHRIRADVSDADGRISRSELTLWVAGEPGLPDPRRQPGSFDVVADREEYQPGDTARILVQPPFHPAEALVTIRSGGVLDTRRLRIEGASHELILPITAEHIPNINVRVEVVDAERGVSRAFGGTSLSVPPHTRALDVRIQPGAAVVAPGGDVTIDVEVRDADGRAAAGAEVALWMVDEAILGLGDYSLRDPLESFYSPRYGYMQDMSSRAWVVLWPQSAGPGTLSGVVVLGDRGHALAGAVVRLAATDLETVTAYDGSFTLRGIAPGDYVLEITAPDGMTGRRNVHVPAEGTHVGNLILGNAGLGAARPEAAAMDAQAGRASGGAIPPVAVAPPPPPPPPPPGAPPSAAIELQSIVVTGNKMEEVDLRTDFAPLAFFAPSLRTDANGRVQVTTRLPESLTRYRIMAVAVSGAQRFGTGDAAVTARRDLMVRMSTPRFLNFGDSFELPVLVQNVTSRTMQVEVAARAAGVNIAGDAGRLVMLAPGARAEVRFDAAAPLPGSAHVQVIAAAAGSSDPAVSDAAAADIPVYTPAALEAFATYGSIDGSAPVVLPLARPVNVIGGFGGLEVSITSTALHSLTDAVLYLHRYPFEGSEHIASRLLSIAALRDVLAAFAAEGLPRPDSLVTAAQRDIADLIARQNDDGGWPFWRGYPTSHPFVSIHVAHALQRAQERGFDVSPEALRRATEYLRGIETHTAPWPQRVRQSAAAYALYVRDRIGDPQAVQEARRLATTAPDRVGGELPIEAAGWLLHILSDDPSSSTAAAELRRTLLNRLVETAGSVTFAAEYEDGEHLLLHSRRRTDAVLLEALIAADADADIVTRLAQSLLAHRTAGRWSGTQENAWVLLALDRYFRTYEATTPAFDSRVWLDERFAGTHAFRGRTTERQHIEVPMPELLRRDADELVIAKAGEGRMYYRAGLRYAPSDPRVPPTNRGFEVSRMYEAVDDPADVRQAGDGSWHVRAGARVRVRISMAAPSVRFHTALVDPLPAGFEPLNPELTGTGFTDDPDAAEPDARRSGMWRPTWFEHQNLRDDRAEAFASLLPAGAWEYTYLARATTPGRFIVLPPRAEMMYQPETFGRGRGVVVVIE